MQSRKTQITMVKWTNAGGQTKRANERSFVFRPPAWRRWRNVKTTYSYSCQINIVWIMYAPNSSILHDKEKTGRILGTRHHYLVNVSGLPYSKQIEFQKKKKWWIFWQPDFFKYLHFKYQQFLWKYQILPTLIWTALVLLRSKRAPGQNGAFCKL